MKLNHSSDHTPDHLLRAFERVNARVRPDCRRLLREPGSHHLGRPHRLGTPHPRPGLTVWPDRKMAA